jgi:glycosyltransferase involved in cell wall biosynthesis
MRKAHPKICVTGLRGFPDVMGGIETHCQHILPKIAKQWPEAEIVVLTRSPYVPKEAFEYYGVRMKPIWSLRNKYLETIMHTFWSILVARFVEKADIIHIHAVGPALLAPLARLLGLHVVFTHHGADYDREKWNAFAKFLLRAGERIGISSANQSIIVGRTLTEKLKARFSGKKDAIHFAPNGIALKADMSASDSDTLSTLKQFKLEKGNYILSVGRLVPEKGFQDLIEAFQKAALPDDVKLVIVGDTYVKDPFSVSLLNKKSDRILFPGFQTHDVLGDLYANCMLFVLPSYHEGLPLAALEAIGAGAPVLLSNIQPNIDMDLDASQYFSVGNINSLAEKLTSNINPMSLDQRKAYLKTYDWQRIASQTSDIYMSALKIDK